MAYLHEIINAAPGADHRVRPGAAVDSGVGADVRVIANHDAAQLWDGDMSARVQREPETLWADTCTLTNRNAVSNQAVTEGRRRVYAAIFTEHDAVTRLVDSSVDLETTPISDVMTPDPKWLSEEDTLAYAMHSMAVGNYRHIPIIQEGKPLRFVSVRGVLKYLHENAR